MTIDERKAVLEQLGRYYGTERFAVTFTATNRGPGAKRVLEDGWDATTPLATPDFGAALVAGRGQSRNIAIVLRPSNLIVIECDSEPDLARIAELNLPVTLTVQSSEPYKRHFYFRPAETLEALPYVAFRFENGKLTADSGRYFLAPPSIHPSGAIYSFLPGLAPGDVDIAELPEDTYRQLAKEAGALQRRPAAAAGATIPEGGRDQALAALAGAMRRRGATETEILAAITLANSQRCRPPLPDSDVARIARSIARYTPHQVNTATVTEAATKNPSERSETHSWTPIDLIEIAAAPPEPPTIGGLVYPGRRHLFSGEPESLKSWAAMVLCVDQIRKENTVMYVDFEMGGRESLARLRDLGLTDAELRAYFIYLEPDESFNDPTIKNDTAELLADRKPTLIILDAFTGALQVHQLDPNKSIDIEAFYRNVIDPLRAHNAGVVVLDHLPKDATNRGRFAIGSERKVGAAEVHLGFEVLVPFGRGRTGRARITTHKDRPGHLPRPRTADLELRSDPTNGNVTWTLHEPETHDGQPFRPTLLMERVSQYLELQHEAVSRSVVEGSVRGKTDGIRIAIDRLTEEGYIGEEPGPHGARLIAVTKTYRQQDEASSPPRPILAPSSPQTGVSTTSPPSPPTDTTGEVLRGEDEDKRLPSSPPKGRGRHPIPEDAGPPDHEPDHELTTTTPPAADDDIPL